MTRYDCDIYIHTYHINTQTRCYQQLYVYTYSMYAHIRTYTYQLNVTRLHIYEYIHSHTRCYQQLSATRDNHFCFSFLEDSADISGRGTFVPLGSRQSLGLNSATTATCNQGRYLSSLL